MPSRLIDPAALPKVDESLLVLDRHPWPGRHRSIAGHDVFVRTTPSTAAHPEPALYVHGLGGASTNFTDFAALLSPWFAAEALDLPGFGRSGPSTSGRYSIEAHAAVVIAMLEASDRGPVHLVGNSMGGAISIRVAALRPELVRTLTLVSPAVPDLKPKQASDLIIPLLLLPGLGDRMMRRNSRGDAERQARAVIEMCFAHPELIPPNRLAEAIDDVVSRRDLPWAQDAFMASLRGIARSYLTPGAGSAWRLMAQITAPTAVVWGDRDRLVSPSRATKVTASIPDAQLLMLSDVGHTAQLEDPISTARAVLGLRRRANAGSAAGGVRS